MREENRGWEEREIEDEDKQRQRGKRNIANSCIYLEIHAAVNISITFPIQSTVKFFIRIVCSSMRRTMY